MADKAPTGPTAVDDLKMLIFVMAVLWFFWYYNGGVNRGPLNAEPDLLPSSIPAATSSVSKNINLTENISVSLEMLESEHGDLYLKIDFTNNGPGIDISNFKLVNMAGLSLTLGTAANLPRQGEINREEDVSIPSGSGVVYVSLGQSPTGYSFRVNKCSGYLSQFQLFEPYLDNNCPVAANESDLPAGCSDFAFGLEQCRAPLAGLGSDMPQSCKDFFNSRLNYNGCVSAHSSDSDFYKNEWRLYLTSGIKLWDNTHGGLKLLDDRGGIIGTTYY